MNNDNLNARYLELKRKWTKHTALAMLIREYNWDLIELKLFVTQQNFDKIEYDEIPEWKNIQIKNSLDYIQHLSENKFNKVALNKTLNKYWWDEYTLFVFCVFLELQLMVDFNSPIVL